MTNNETVAEMAAWMHDSKTWEVGITPRRAGPRIDAAGFIRRGGIVFEKNVPEVTEK